MNNSLVRWIPASNNSKPCFFFPLIFYFPNLSFTCMLSCVPSFNCAFIDFGVSHLTNRLHDLFCVTCLFSHVVLWQTHTHTHAWTHKSIPLVCFCVELVPSFFPSIPANLLVKQTHYSYYSCHDKHGGLTSQHFWPLWPDRTRGNMPSRRPKPCRTPGPSSTWRTSRLRAAPATGTDSRRGVWEWLRLFLLTQLLYGVLSATGEKILVQSTWKPQELGQWTVGNSSF